MALLEGHADSNGGWKARVSQKSTAGVICCTVIVRLCSGIITRCNRDGMTVNSTRHEIVILPMDEREVAHGLKNPVLSGDFNWWESV